MIQGQVLHSNKAGPGWWLLLLLVMCFTLATLFVPRAQWWGAVPRAADWNQGRSQANNVFKLVLGEGRHLFANEFLVMADDYFHSGYYPSIFDRQIQHPDVAKPALGQPDEEDSTKDDFLGPPPDWIAALHRYFVPNRHTHLSSGGPSGNENFSSVQQILPWLKLATDMNPHFIEAYQVGYYWLYRLHMREQARDFLLEGLHNNPGDCGLLFDLGWLYNTEFHDPDRARNVWQAALRCWRVQSDSVKKTVKARRICDNIAINLSHLEEKEGNWREALEYLKVTKQVSPNPDAIQKQIDAVEKKITAGR